MKDINPFTAMAVILLIIGGVLVVMKLVKDIPDIRRKLDNDEFKEEE